MEIVGVLASLMLFELISYIASSKFSHIIVLLQYTNIVKLSLFNASIAN